MRRLLAALLLVSTTVTVTATASGEELGELLYEKGLISREELARTKANANPDRSLGELLYEKGLISREELARTRTDLPSPDAHVAVVPTPLPTAAEAEAASAEMAPTPTTPTTLAGTTAAKAGYSLLKQVELSTLIYADWAYYTHTGYGPQFLTQINPPGPGNDGFNSFDLTRTYLNFIWKPSDHFTIRVTPNIYREVAPAGTVNTSQSSSVSTNLNGNLGLRLKYAYLQLSDLLLPGQQVRLGQIENPLVPWEETLYGFRFVNLVPLNFLAYSSTDLGIATFGPVTVNGARYADYWFGIYNGSSFHSAEFNEKRSPQGRVTLYPFAETPALAGLGVTGFFSYGYTDVAPDTPDAVIKRLAGLVHYSSPRVGLAFEVDGTHNNNNFANFFSAAGPPSTIPDPMHPGQTLPNPIFQLYSGILNSSAPGFGYSVFGHLDVSDTPFTLFGLWQRWYPNTNVTDDPLDADRFVGGVAYRVFDWLRFAVDSQNLVYFQHGPAVPTDVHAFFTNLEIDYPRS